MEKNETTEIIFIRAAGGLVQNGEGEYLMIFRNGRWDLPKGKQEEGEALPQTALREVAEECGVRDLVLGRFIASTRHSYWEELSKQLVFKQTHWYYMFVSGRPELCPQVEEGVEECRWCTPETADRYLDDSYPSIRWLFCLVKEKNTQNERIR
jgi:8-oxo-dGTP pyrophosphatase MutT (NUDIX family)